MGTNFYMDGRETTRKTVKGLAGDGQMILKLLFPVYVCEYSKEDDENELSAEDAAVYCGLVMEEIKRDYQYFIFDIARRGWLSSRKVAAPLEGKVNSVFPAVGVYQGGLWGVLNCSINEELAEEEIQMLEDVLIPEFEDGYGDIQRLRYIELGGGRHISVEFMPSFYRQGFLSREETEGLLQGIDLEADYKRQEIENPIKLIRPEGNFTARGTDRILQWLGQLKVHAEMLNRPEKLEQVKEKLHACMDEGEALAVLGKSSAELRI